MKRNSTKNIDFRHEGFQCKVGSSKRKKYLCKGIKNETYSTKLKR